MLHQNLYNQFVNEPLLKIMEGWLKQSEFLKEIDLMDKTDAQAKNILNKIESLDLWYNEVAGVLVFMENYKEEIDKANEEVLKIYTENEVLKKDNFEKYCIIRDEWKRNIILKKGMVLINGVYKVPV